MAVIKKTLFPKNLDNYSVLVNDLDTNSKYFKITELSDTLTGGKNAFLIAGSDYLVSDTKIQIELKDSAGNIIYHEPGEGYFSSSFNGAPFVTEYYEGVSKVVSVYVYPDTSYGPCTITILGELNQYEDENGMVKPIPMDWENKYNVKWQKTINVNPSLANTTKIRFYQRPVVNITEILSPIYRIENGLKVDSGTNQSFADIKLSKLETFAGDVKRIKVFRTSEGDISDYNLIQDILVESKELLTSYGLTGSVVGQTGIITSETLKSFWNTGSLNAYLTSSRVESGVRLTGSGNFTYTSSLDIKSTNTYELNFDAFYSSSTPSNLGIYLASGSLSSSIGTLYGIAPTKNLLDTVIPFKIAADFPSASLYFSQSQGEWHLGNISLKLSQDTAFSPDEISFITTMPTVIGNETYNFKFEFYDVNNNYVPVAVTQSANFTGGTNTTNTALLITASLSQSLAAIAAVSTSISGTMTVYSSSASSSVNILSGSVSGTIGSVSSSVSGTIGRVSGSISGSIYSLSGSVSSSLTLTSGSINLVSSSLLFTSQSLSSSLTTLSSSLSSSFANAASQSTYQVYSASQYLDKFIFTDENGKLNKPPDASDPGLYLGSEYLGYYNGNGTSGWKTYMDNQGDFYLTSSTVGGGFLAWDSSTATLQIQGAINIQGGNAATTTALSSSLNAVSGAINSATSSLSTSVAATTFTTATGLIAKPPGVLVGSPSGLYLGSTNLGYYSAGVWKTYMADNGNFYLSGAGSDSLTWAGGVLTINGAINITGGNAATTTNVSNAVTSGSNAATNAATSGSNAATNAVTSGSLFAANAAASASLSASAVDAKVFTNSSGLINKTPSTTASGLYLGSTFLGYYNGTDWKTYMANNGNFFLSGAGSDSLSWSSGVLTINGAINITGGNAATTSQVSSAAGNAVTSGSNAASTAQSNAQSFASTAASTAQSNAQSFATTAANNAVSSGSAFASAVDDKVFTNALGRITKTPTPGSTSGLYLGNTIMGFYNGAAWKTYMDNTGLFYLTGSANGNALLWDGNTLTIKGNLAVGSSVPNAAVTGLGTLATQNTVTNAQVTGLGALATQNTVTNAQVTGLGALATANSVSTAQVTGLGALATKDSITLSYVTDKGSLAGLSSISSAEIDANAVTNAKIAADAVTEGKIAADAVTSGKISAGAIVAGKIAADAVTADKIAAGSITAVKIEASAITADKIAAGSITAAKIEAGAITADKIGANEITATKISSLSFSGKTATFDQGSVGGWTMDSTGLYKTTGAYTLRLGANAQRISISQANVVDSIDRVRLDSSLDIPVITVSDTGSLYWSAAGQNILTVYEDGSPNFAEINTDFDTPDGSPSHPAVSFVYGIIGLVYASEEIWIESEGFPNIENTIIGQSGFDTNAEVYGYYNVTLRVRKFPTSTDALNQTNVDATYGDKQVLVAYKEFRHNQQNSDRNLDKSQVFGATLPADGPGGINTPAPGSPGNWYRVELRQIWNINAYSPNPQPFGGYISANRPTSDIFVKFGRVTNGYSVFSPGGLQVYQGVRNYINASLPSGSSGDAANFFIVKGKSQIIGSLDVTSGFSANSKQFKIQHPLNENKWLYHTSTESPRADLIYRGTLQLQSGAGSASIDSASNMTNGTFNALTKNPQLFLQNNESFDRIKGYVQSGSVYVLSENQDSTASIDWSVIAERQDAEMLKSPLYDRNGKYKTENYKGEYLEATRSERLAKFNEVI